MLRHEKQKIKRWLYSSSSNWHYWSWWSTDKKHRIEKLELSSKEPFSKRFQILLVTQKRTIVTPYISVQLRYPEKCVTCQFIHLYSKAYKQHDYLLKRLWFLVFGNRDATSCILPIEFIKILLPVIELIPCVYQTILCQHM